MKWLNEPAKCSQIKDQIWIKTLPKTDFWRITHYDFVRDTGHFYFEQVDTDFDIEVTIRGDYHDLYDQAGIMIRLDAYRWIKAGIEYVDGIQYLSAVVTHEHSDWSVMPLFPSPESLRLRVERRKEAVHLSYLTENSTFKQFRLAYFPPLPVQVGIMCASPEGNGFEVTFEHYQLQQKS